MVHKAEFWKRWEESESMNQADRERLARGHRDIYLNQESVRCAR